MIKEECKYHHIGLPTSISRKNEEYNEEWKFYGSGYFESQFGIEWLRFDMDSPLHPLIKTVPHIAFVVNDIKKYISEQKVIYGPNSPAEGVKVCFIEIDGAPIEFLQFNKPESEIWPNHNKLINSVNGLKNEEELIDFKYHHFGICANFNKTGAINWRDQKLNTTNYHDYSFGIQWMVFDKECNLPSVVQTTSHVAFQVKDLKKAIKGQNVIVKPYSPSKGVLVAFIEENGAPIKVLQID